ncbi:hypothetical protein FRC03_007552 [Tulasnella sp. 419]|nr:hypothetical protein FRC03_007552 [Tulasnella sp. 419]
MTATSNFGDSGMFGDGNLFEVPDSQSQSDTKQEPTQDGEDSDDDEPAVTEEEIKQLTAALQSSAIDDASDRSAWMSSPSYAPLYLSTSSEYIIPDPKKPPPKQSISANEPSGVGGGWGVEGYENAKGDEVFEKFAKRVANEGQQCVRYELSGAPLPFQSTDGVYKKLFPSRLPTMTTTGGRVGSVVTKGAFAVATSEEPTGKHVYDPSSIPSCPYCKGPRVFECQLMPNMISVLKRPSDGKQKKQSEVERRNELARVLLKQDTGGNKESGETTASQQLGMEWGTCFVFSCLNDCALEDGSKEVKSCWREEIVMVQWET